MLQHLDTLADQAQKLSDNGEWEKALECYRKIFDSSEKPCLPVCNDFGSLLRETSMNAGIRRNLNNEIDRLNNYTLIYKETVNFFPKSDIIFRYLGSTLAHLHHFDEAIQYLDQAIELNPQQPQWVFHELRLCRARQEYHRQPNHKNIYFLHIHKAAGTTFVNLARQNFCTFYKQYKNGNPWQNNELVRFWRLSLNEQIQFLTSPDHNFIANETCIGEYLPIHPKIAYITILRNPLDRILSDFRHRRNAGDYPKEMSFEDFVNSEKFTKLNWTNDFLTRAFIKKPGKSNLNNDDLQLAKQRLSQFDYVFFVDSFKEDIKVMEQFNWILLDTDQYRSGTKANSNVFKELENSPSALNKLVDRNQIDLEFYEYARSIRQSSELI